MKPSIYNGFKLPLYDDPSGLMSFLAILDYVYVVRM